MGKPPVGMLVRSLDCSGEVGSMVVIMFHASSLLFYFILLFIHLFIECSLGQNKINWPKNHLGCFLKHCCYYYCAFDVEILYPTCDHTLMAAIGSQLSRIFLTVPIFSFHLLQRLI